MTDEKLAECSAEATGVYIRLMCLFHKSAEYGSILLRQKDKQNDSNILNFATKLVKHLPYSVEVIERGLKELIDENVLQLEGDKLIQKRMVQDNELSIKRSEAGKKGGFATAKSTAKNTAKNTANYESENEDVNEDEIEILNLLNETAGKKYRPVESNMKFIRARLAEKFTINDFRFVIQNKTAEWSGTENEKFLRPETLFNATKFQSYVNEPPFTPDRAKVETFTYDQMVEKAMYDRDVFSRYKRLKDGRYCSIKDAERLKL
nr:hypothetical protein 2 [bacterium]